MLSIHSQTSIAARSSVKPGIGNTRSFFGPVLSSQSLTPRALDMFICLVATFTSFSGISPNRRVAFAHFQKSKLYRFGATFSFFPLLTFWSLPFGVGCWVFTDAPFLLLNPYRELRFKAICISVFETNRFIFEFPPPRCRCSKSPCKLIPSSFPKGA